MRLTVSSSEVHEDRVRDCVLSLSCDIREYREKKREGEKGEADGSEGVIVVLFIYY